MLSVVRTPEGLLAEDDVALRDTQSVLSEALLRSIERAIAAETLITVATDIWGEIARVARLHRCETILIGLPDLENPTTAGKLEALVHSVDADVMVVRAPRRWRLDDVSRVLIPVAGGRRQSRLRARLLASLSRDGERSFTYLRTVPPGTTTDSRRRTERILQGIARDEALERYRVRVEDSASPLKPIVQLATGSDLVVIALEPWARHQRALTPLVLDVARMTDTPLVLIAQRRSRLGAIRSRFGPRRRSAP